MVGKDYFERRIGDIYYLSPIAYMGGEGDLRDQMESIKVQWELNVSITGEHLLVLTSERVIPSDRCVNSDGTFVEWSLIGTTTGGESTVTAVGVTLSQSFFSSERIQSTYFSHFRQMDIIPAYSGTTTRLEALARNLSFLGLETTIRDSLRSLDRFHVAVAGRQIYFYLSEQENELKNLIKIGRIDRALMSKIHIPLALGETVEDGLRILDILEWLVSFLTLNQISAPLIRFMDGEKFYGWRIRNTSSHPYKPEEIVDNGYIGGGIKTCVEAIYDDFLALEVALQLRRFVDMILEMHQQRKVDLKLAVLIMAYELFCTSFLAYIGKPPSQDSNIQQKMNRINYQLQFIPKTHLNDTLRGNIRNPLFHQGVIVGADIKTLWDWYTQYFDLLLQIVFVILGYSGSFISRVSHTPIPVSKSPYSSAP
jgi:hypothetical protein